MIENDEHDGHGPKAFDVGPKFSIARRGPGLVTGRQNAVIDNRGVP
jgi:hypothetical protein